MEWIIKRIWSWWFLINAILYYLTSVLNLRMENQIQLLKTIIQTNI